MTDRPLTIYLRVRPRKFSKDRDQLFLLHLALIVNVLVFDDALLNTMSSSVRRAQSSASRFVRNVFEAVGHPVLRITAFHFPRSVFTRVATRNSGAVRNPALYLKCTSNVFSSWWAYQDSNLEPKHYECSALTD
jgi:hypothetical protein